MRDRILEEIRRLSDLNGGKAPGKKSFANETGIRESSWAGVFWARWSDAVVEAGLVPNGMQQRLDTDLVLASLSQHVVTKGRIPTCSEWKLLRQSDRSLPTYNTLVAHLGGREAMIRQLQEWAAKYPERKSVGFCLAETSKTEDGEEVPIRTKEGHVYMLRSGKHYKIGRSDELERRIKEIRVALPEAVELVHAIRTDDPPGIEAYWHRRFASVRTNGEWFKLTVQDVAALKRRKFQ